MNKYLIISLIVMSLTISIFVFGYRTGSQMLFDQGQAIVNNGMIIFPDTFSVTFEQPFPDTNYSISIEGFATHYDMLIDAHNGAWYGHGKLAKQCYISNKTTTGFKGECNYKILHESPAYNFRGEYTNFKSISYDYNFTNLGNTWNKIDWQVSYKMPMVRP